MILKKFPVLSLLTLVFIPTHVFAHKEHNHDTAKIVIAIQGNQGKFNFEIPAASLYGFEHAAKSEKEKQVVEAAKNKFEKNIGNIVIIEDRLKCNFQTIQISPFVPEDDDENETEKNHSSKNKKKLKGTHGDFKAEILVNCKEPIKKAKIFFGFKKYFPNIENISIEGLSNEKQFSLKIKNDEGSLEL